MRRCPVMGRPASPGAPLLLLQGERRSNGWLLAGPGWVPPPRVDPDRANADWRVWYCATCDKHVAHLAALEHIDTGSEVICSSLPAPDLDTILRPYEVTFDGGGTLRRRGREGGRGRSDSLALPARGGGELIHIAPTIVALPDVDNAQIAEATGCRAALAALIRTDANRRAARVVGENLAVVRYGAGTGRLQRPILQAQMELAMDPLAQRGWALQWQAVRRRLDKAADRLATLGVFWAACLRRQGIAQVTTHTVWHTSSSPTAPCPPHVPDPSAASLDPAIVQHVADHQEDLARASRRAGSRFA